MTKVKIYKDSAHNFKSVVEIDCRETYSIFISAIAGEMASTENEIKNIKSNKKFKSNNHLLKKHQKKYDKLEELLIKFDQPEISNEKRGLKQKFKEMEKVYQTLEF